MVQRRKGETEGSDVHRRTSRLLRGWVHCPQQLEGLFGLEQEFGRRAEAPRERAIEEAPLQEEIERAQRAVRELMGIGGEGLSFREEETRPASENARLWQAVTHLATTIDLLRKRLELLEVRHQGSEKR